MAKTKFKLPKYGLNQWPDVFELIKLADELAKDDDLFARISAFSQFIYDDLREVPFPVALIRDTNASPEVVVRLAAGLLLNAYVEADGRPKLLKDVPKAARCALASLEMDAEGWLVKYTVQLDDALVLACSAIVGSRRLANEVARAPIDDALLLEVCRDGPFPKALEGLGVAERDIERALTAIEIVTRAHLKRAASLH